jgi:hypothetical protein
MSSPAPSAELNEPFPVWHGVATFIYGAMSCVSANTNKIPSSTRMATTQHIAHAILCQVPRADTSQLCAAAIPSSRTMMAINGARSKMVMAPTLGEHAILHCSRRQPGRSGASQACRSRSGKLPPALQPGCHGGGVATRPCAPCSGHVLPSRPTAGTGRGSGSVGLKPPVCRGRNRS